MPATTAFCVPSRRSVSYTPSAAWFIARTMAAALGADLILDVDRSGARPQHRLDGTRNVERGGAEAGVHVDQQRQLACVRDPAHVGQYVVEIADAKIGEAKGPGGHAAA